MTNTVALAIKVTADASQAASGIDGVTTKTSKMGQAGKVAGRLLAGGLIIAAGAAVKATQAAVDDEAAQSKLASALKNATGARADDIAKVEDWIAAQGKALGVADDQLRPALESLVTATKDVGKAQELASIAMDIGARKGESAESVAKKLAKAYASGNVGALAKYGVATKDAEGKTKSFEQVQKDLAKTYKGAASDAADTAAGKQQKLKVAMGELQEEIGAKLLPVLLKAAEYGLKVVDWITKNQTAAAAIVGTLGALLAVVKLVSVATTIWSTVMTIASGVSKAFAAVQAAFNAVMAANPVVLVVIAVVALVAALVLAYKKSETFRNIVNGAFSAVAKAAGAAVDFIKNNWEKILVILTGPVGLAVVAIIKHRDKIQGAFEAVVNWVRDKWGAITDLLSGPIQAARDAINSAFSAVLTRVQTVIDTVQALYDKLVALKNAATGGGGGVRTPDQSGSSRTVNGTAGRGAAQVVNINVTVPGGFIGDRIQLVRALRTEMAADLRRLGLAT